MSAAEDGPVIGHMDDVTDRAPLDVRFNAGLLHDVLSVLDEHGYAPPAGSANRAYADSVVALGDLVRAYEGRTR